MTEPLPIPVTIDGSPHRPAPPKLHSSLLNAVKAAIIGTDLAGQITYWNPFAEQIYGWKAADVLGRNVVEITVSSENEERAREHLAAVIAGGTWAGEFEVRCKDGHLIGALVTLSLVTDEAGRANGIVGISQDLRGLREAEGALRRSEEQFQAFANSLPELCWIANADGHIFWYNERWYEYTGTTARQMEGWGWQTVHHPEVLPEVMARWNESIATGAPFEMEFPLRGGDGSYRWFLTRVKPLRDPDGRVTRWYGTNTDIDEHKRLLRSLGETRDELEKRVQERTAELHAATDSLRDLSARLLRMRDDEQRRLARELHDSVGQLLAAIGMNISVVSSEAHKLSPTAAKCVAENAALIDEVSREIRTISHLLHPPLLDEAGLASALRWFVEGFAKRSRIAIELEIPPELGRLPHDAEIAIFRMVQESLTNIHRHAESTTAVVRVRKEETRLLIEVQDRGKGIPEEMQHKLSRAGRIGVGFSGMRERLRQLNGNLEIDSSVNGTIVRATLPIL